MRIKIIDDMKDKFVPRKYAVMVIILGALIAFAGILNFQQVYSHIPQSVQTLCIG